MAKRSPLRNARRVSVIVAVVLILALATLSLLAWRRARSSAGSTELRFVAGPELELTVDVAADGVGFQLHEASLPAGIEGRLTLATAAGPVTTVATSRAGTLEFWLPAVRAGVTPYRVSVGEVTLQGMFERRAGPAMGEIDLRVGARAIRVGSDRSSAAVVQPLDANGNVAPGPVDLLALLPDGSEWRTELVLRDLIAWSYLPAPTRPGLLQVVAVSDLARAERAEVDVLAAEAAAGAFDLRRGEATSNGRDSWRLALTDLRDAFGNRAGGVALLSGGAVGPDRLDLFSVRPVVVGEVDWIVPAAPIAGGYEVVARADGFTAAPAPLTAEAVPLRTPLIAWGGAGAAPRLHIGPIVDRYGALPDDGTEVRIRLLDSSDRPLLERVVPLRSGRVDVELAALPSAGVRVELALLGTILRLELPGDERPTDASPSLPGEGVPGE